ncbi:MAG: hypothetical protein ACPLRW_07285 [Moorellales bacterium]
MQAASQVYDLTEYRDLRAVVDGCIRSYLKQGTIRAKIAMENAVAAAMSKYRRREMRFGTYTVRLETFDGRTVPIIRARRVSKGCPRCGRRARAALHSHATAALVRDPRPRDLGLPPMRGSVCPVGAQ